MLPIGFFLIGPNIGPNIGHNTITDNVRLKQIHQTFAAELAEILRPLEFGAVPHYAPQFLTLNQPMNLETKKKRREKSTTISMECPTSDWIRSCSISMAFTLIDWSTAEKTQQSAPINE